MPFTIIAANSEMRPSFSASYMASILCSMCALTIIVLAFMCNVLSVAMTEIYITGMNINDPTPVYHSSSLNEFSGSEEWHCFTWIEAQSNSSMASVEHNRSVQTMSLTCVCCVHPNVYGLENIH